jgi:hypothetical protein
MYYITGYNIATPPEKNEKPGNLEIKPRFGDATSRGFQIIDELARQLDSEILSSEVAM